MGQQSSRKTDFPASALPRSGEALAGLARAVEAVLGFLEPHQCRQQFRLAALQSALKNPRNILRDADFLQEVKRASHQQLAQGAPSPATLLPYLDQEEWRRLRRQSEAARARMHEPARPSPESLRDRAAAFSEMLAADESLLEMLRQLRRAIFAGLDRADADSADSSADTRKKIPRVPKNFRVLELIRELDHRKGNGETKTAIALQLTLGDEKEAKSLLRQVRRYQNLLR